MAYSPLDDPNQPAQSGQASDPNQTTQPVSTPPGSYEGFPLGKNVEAGHIELGNNYEIEQQKETIETLTDSETFVPLEALANETLTQPISETPSVQENNTSDATNSAITPTNTPQIIDQTQIVPPIHHLEHPKDTLTQAADAEEEQFIKEVEKHHGHQ